MLATLLDEGLARCCFPALPGKVGVTASLKVKYLRPAKAGAYYVLKARTVKVEGRKAWVQGGIEELREGADEGEGERVVEAEALFIEPRNIKVRSFSSYSFVLPSLFSSRLDRRKRRVSPKRFFFGICVFLDERCSTDDGNK